MKYTIDQAWELLNDMRMNKEAWSEDLGNKGGIEVEYDCIQDFIDAGKLDKLSETLHMDSDIILQLIKRYSQFLQLPKKNQIKYAPRKEVATIQVPEEEEQARKQIGHHQPDEEHHIICIDR